MKKTPASKSRETRAITRHAVLELQPLPPMVAGRLCPVARTTLALPFNGNAKALITAAVRAYPRRRPTQYFLGMKDRTQYLSLVISFGVDRSGNRVSVHVDLHETDIPVVATYLFTHMRATDVSAVWQPSPTRRAR